MSKIKQRESVKGIKALDKTKILSSHMKDALIKTKERSEETQRSEHDTPHAYATDAVSEKAGNIEKVTAYKAERIGRQSLKNVPKTIQNAKAGAVNIKQKIQGAIKTVKKTAKTKKEAKTVIKTSKHAAKASAKAAQATLKTSQRAAQASVQATKLTIKAIVATVKAAIATVKGLITLIAAGGWVAVVIILITCMAAFLLSSPFGLFYSDEKSSDSGSMTITSAITQINNDFVTKIEQIENKNPHDEVDGMITPQNWKDVLAVYAVKYSTSPDNPVEVATMDNAKFESLKSVFWDMNSITFVLETVEPTTVSGKESASALQAKTILHIAVKNKSCSDMAAQYAFSSEQQSQLVELLKPEYEDIWAKLLSHLS